MECDEGFGLGPITLDPMHLGHQFGPKFYIANSPITSPILWLAIDISVQATRIHKAWASATKMKCC